MNPVQVTETEVEALASVTVKALLSGIDAYEVSVQMEHMVGKRRVSALQEAIESKIDAASDVVTTW